MISALAYGLLLLLDGTLIRLPGTQPGMTSPADSAGTCASCHTSVEADWRRSGMAHAARDPFFNALLAVTNARTLPLGLDAGEYCLRCHAPVAWLAGRSHELSTEHLTPTDLEGVQCDFCHRSVDPLNPPPGAATAGVVPGYGNGMFVVMPLGEPRRGPGGGPAAPHATVRDPFLASPAFCGTCHEVSNPYFDADPSRTPPAHQPPLERTYSEWAMSSYAEMGPEGRCQSCHDPHAARRTPELLRSAARLEAAAGRTAGGTLLLVRVTNLTGHKLPTGFPEGRRVWLEVLGMRNGAPIWTSGMYDHAAGSHQEDPQRTLYEARPGLTATAAAIAGLPPGPSYHAALTDTIFFDNRIPPRGYRRATFSSRRAAPVGAAYADGQFWDERRYLLPAETDSVVVRLFYQSASPSFAAFLRDENAGNPYDWNNWGARAYDLWRAEGGPVEMAAVRTGVGEGAPWLGEFQDPLLPVVVELQQNYPNPFNAGTRIRYAVGRSVADARLTVFDAAGREVVRLVEGPLEGGAREVLFTADGLASGVYLVRLDAGGAAAVRKIVLIR